MSAESGKSVNGLVLGLDIGAASVGWALVNYADGRPVALKDMGARVFPAAVGKGDIEAGNETSSAKGRREARSTRRQIARTRRRLTKVAKLLQRNDLLPAGELDSPKAIHRYFLQLDSQLFPDLKGRDEQVKYYRLRARALDGNKPLTEHEIGRIFYHLAHRRGFLSNAKATTRTKDDGEVKTTIGELAARMGGQTLGQYLSDLDPQQQRLRGPKQYVGRKEQVQPEFEAIWQAQAVHYPELLTDDLKQQVDCAIFFQRDFRVPTRHLGFCDLETEPTNRQRRAPMALLAAQRFRLLDKVSTLRISEGLDSRPLDSEQWRKLIDKLDVTEEQTFDQIRKLLKLPESASFNLEASGKQKVIGNRTAARLANIVGKKRWAAMTCAEQRRLVDDLLTRTPEAIERRYLNPRRGYDAETARKLSEVKLDSGHSRLSRRALEKVLPHMEQGDHYAAAREKAYPPCKKNALPLLPPLDAVADVRNPIVTRALTEVRKIVNTIVREYGLPDRVRIELARDLKRDQERRKYLHGRMLENEKARDEAKKTLQAMARAPSPGNIDKYLLWQECNHRCPYCGRHISCTDLFGEPPQVQVAHILPRDRAMGFGNSFLNKTLACHTCNHEQGSQTPWEAFGQTPRWETILREVSAFKDGGRSREVTDREDGKRSRKEKRPRITRKLELFQVDKLEELETFTKQQLTDTQYASRLGVEFLGRLYGAGADGNDPHGNKRVRAGRGQVTSSLRGAWGLSRILGGGEKRRDDHRHHAIDAVCIALTDEKTIRDLSTASARGLRERGQRPGRMDHPWPSFYQDVENGIKDMVVSHRVSRRVAGAMHKDKHYGRYEYEGKVWAHLRVPLAKLSPNDVKNIVDSKVQKAVVCALNGRPAKEAFKLVENHPRLGRNPIHKVRVRRLGPLRTVGDADHARHVELESNHHIAVYANGESEWQSQLVTRLDAMRRLRDHRRDHKSKRRCQQVVVLRDERLRFSLTEGEAIEVDDGPGGRAVWIVNKLTWRRRDDDIRVGVVKHSDARRSTAKDGAETRDLKEWSAKQLQEKHCRKVLITPLGEVRIASD